MMATALTALIVFLLDRTSKAIVAAQMRGAVLEYRRFLRIRRVEHAKRVYANGIARGLMFLVWLWALAAAWILSSRGHHA